MKFIFDACSQQMMTKTGLLEIKRLHDLKKAKHFEKIATFFRELAIYVNPESAFEGILSFIWGSLICPAGAGLAYLAVAFLIGLVLWTFVEYNIHRFFFHFCPKTPWQERIVFLFHGVHHAQPRMKTRLVMTLLSACRWVRS